MGGGRDASGVAIYRRVNGKYIRQVPYKKLKTTEIVDKKEVKPITETVQVKPKTQKPAKNEFSKQLKKVKTKKEFLDLVRQRYGKNSVSPDFVNKNDFELIKKVVGTVADLEEKYPFMKGFIHSFTSTLSGKQHLAEMGNGDLDINHSIWSNKKAPELYSVSGGANPPNKTPEQVVAHEFGHAIHKYMYKQIQKYYKGKNEDKYYDALASENNGKILAKIEERAYKKIGLSVKDGRGQISLYASLAGYYGAKPPHEAFAEAFADVFSNKNNASAASKALVNEVLKEVKKWNK